MNKEQKKQFLTHQQKTGRKSNQLNMFKIFPPINNI